MIRAIDIPWWRSGTVIALAALTIWLCRESAPPNISPESGVIMDLPTLVGEYWGTSEPVSPSELPIASVYTPATVLKSAVRTARST
jgi:hypothetical protein